MRPIPSLFFLLVISGLPGCGSSESNLDGFPDSPKLAKIPRGVVIKAYFDPQHEFMVNMIPLHSRPQFQPSFSLANEPIGSFSSERPESLIAYYKNTSATSEKRILLKSDHYLVLWDARDRKVARGTDLQQWHFSPDWDSYRQKERVLIDQFIRVATKERIEVWINEKMDLTKGRWRLMTPPFDLNVHGDTKALERKVSEIEEGIKSVFYEALKSGYLPGVDPQQRGVADVLLPDGMENVDKFPRRAVMKVTAAQSEKLFELHYVQTAPASAWILKSAWRVHGDGKRTRLTVPK